MFDTPLTPHIAWYSECLSPIPAPSLSLCRMSENDRRREERMSPHLSAWVGGDGGGRQGIFAQSVPHGLIY